MRPVHERLSLLGVKAGAPVALLPHGGLAALPLHLAWRMERGRRRYFLDDYTVSYAPGASMLAFAGKLAAQAAPGSARLLAVIDPSGDLPFANAEGSAVARNLPRDDVRSLIGTAATRATVLQEAARCNYVHFACHGTFHWSNVELSSLHLADGELTLAELTGLQNQIVSRLVSLSGCDTGISQVFRRVQQNVFTSGADEYVGLPSCFLQAGVPTVVSTLWPIEDYATSLVMGAFHARLFRTKDGVAQALRVAQRALRDLTRDEIQALLQVEQAAWKKRARVRRLRPSERELQESIAAQIAELKGCSDEHPFAHPDFWGAFITVGAG